MFALDSWGFPEHGEALCCELARLRHGRQREALGRGGKWSYGTGASLREDGRGRGAHGGATSCSAGSGKT